MNIIHDTLINWYAENHRDLPWRHDPAPYEVWLSEVILQQTRVNQGMDYYLRFIERWPTVTDLAKASEEEVLKIALRESHVIFNSRLNMNEKTDIISWLRSQEISQ